MTETCFNEGRTFVEWTATKLFSNPDIPVPCLNVGMSPDFSISGTKYFLEIFTTGKKYKDRGWVSVFLKRIDRFPTKYCLSYTLGIRMHDGSIFKSVKKMSEFLERDHVQSYNCYGVARLLRTSEFDANYPHMTFFCIARKCTNGINSSVAESASQTVSLRGVQNLQQNFRDLFLNESLSDVIFRVDDQEFKAHRLVLSARSTVFCAMFHHDTREKRTGTVAIEDSDPHTFRMFLLYLYTGDLSEVTPSIAMGLYKLSDKYHLVDLKEECVRCLVEALSVESFCDVVLLATQHEDSELFQTATDFFALNSEVILQTSAWLSLGKEHFSIANRLFSETMKPKKRLIKRKRAIKEKMVRKRKRLVNFILKNTLPL